MAILKGFQYEGNQVTMRLAEGAWTDDDKHKEGGSFALPLKNGQTVTLQGAVDYLVTESVTGSTPIGILMDVLGGTNATNGRYGTVRMFGSHIEECEVFTGSDALTIGSSIKFYGTGGTYGKGMWWIDTASNDTIVLNTTSASGSIAAGERVHVLFGATKF
jgi:hypothetical protein